MRYEDWDVLLFPVGEDPKVPIKEFKVACHVVQDTEFAHTQRSPGIPTVCCFVPSLVAGMPFQVSIHSWNPPTISQFTQSVTSFADNVVFHARLLVDGRLVASTAFDCSAGWPHVVANSLEFSKNGDLEPLKFPFFRQELLRQDHWSPADDLGRIRVVISEGFPRDSYTTPVERVKNVVAFSFQHAPLEILETSGIAWPNQSMWQRIPHEMSKPALPVKVDNPDSHAHSPRRRTQQDKACAYTIPIFQSMDGTNSSLFSSANFQVPSAGPILGCSSEFDDLGGLGASEMYLDWLQTKTGTGLGEAQSGSGAHNAAARKGRKSSTDTSMPDYVSLGGHKSNKLDNVFGSFPIHEDDDASMGSLGMMQAPVNTPTSGQSMSFGSGKTMFPLFGNSGNIPNDLAETLTASLLNQPAPLKGGHQHAGNAPATEIKSRKENRSQLQDMRSPSNGAESFLRPDTQATRKVSQQQQRVPTGASLPAGAVASAIQSPQYLETKKGLQTGTRTSPTSNFTTSLASESTPENALRAISGNSDKGSKRMRNFTPASAKAIDEADEPKRGSPRLRMSPFAEAEDGDLG